ncbi:hypothetical protein FGD67_03515 [Colwellia sp. M166]|uniref:hypothetical protein n=1 Tax=Colwellia sp. M166 TaxID=2583805 RepID=UPI00211F46AE|nr:hypothetical protein [Colwellia sp. M166]UUO22376.1 hypothetical protein FGD67_03515 [Colwellia sp. M166]
MKIDNYFEDIKSRKPINYRSFKKKAFGIGLTDSDLLKLFEVKKFDNNKVIVNIIHEDEFNKLFQKYNSVTTFKSRKEAAPTGRTHALKVSGTTCNVRQGLNHPHTVIVSKDGEIFSNVEARKQLLIIENEENFLKIMDTQKFLKMHANIDLEKMDVMWGSGNRAANSYLANYYSRYEKIFCFFDYELGVIKTAQSIYSLLINKESTHFEFVIADNAHMDLKEFGVDLNKSHIKKLEKIRNECNVLAKAVNLMINTGKIMEQEVYL